MNMYLPDDLTVTELLDSAAESREMRHVVLVIPASQVLHADTLVSAMGDTYETPIDHVQREYGWVWIKPSGRKWLRLAEHEEITVRNPF